MSSRDMQGDQLDSQDLYFLFDCTAHHNIGKLQACFVDSTGNPVEKSAKQLYISMDEDSLHARKTRLKSGASFEQMEYVSLVSKTDYGDQVPTIKRLHFKGTNGGNKIGDVDLPALDDAWSLTHSQKLQMYGEHRVEVGGKTKGAGENELQKGKRKAATDVEPAFWHGRASLLYTELLHSYQLKGIIDLSPGDGVLATLCAVQRVPYVGFCMTDVHTDLLKARCLQSLLTLATEEGDDKIYDPELAALVKGKAPESGAAKGGGGGEKKKPRVAAPGVVPAAGSGGLLEDFKKKIEEIKKKNEEEEKEKNKGETADPDDEH